MNQTEYSRQYYLVEYFKSVREEILLRVKWRDGYLKIQMLAIVVLFGIANRIKVIEEITVSDTEHPELLLLTPIISFVLCSLYLIEDNVIGALSEYCRAVCIAEKELNLHPTYLRNYDSSHQLLLGNSSKWTKRKWVQFCLFVVIPVIFSINGFSRVTNSDNLNKVIDLMNSSMFFKWSIYEFTFWLGILISFFTSVMIYFGNKKRLEFKSKETIDSICL